jgi:hypothetical protein
MLSTVLVVDGNISDKFHHCSGYILKSPKLGFDKSETILMEIHTVALVVVH